MNPGKLRTRGTLLRLSGGNDLIWAESEGLWMQIKETGKKNLFSKVGIGSDGVEITLRKRDISLHDAILWRGQHYFLTNISEEGSAPVYLKIQAARIPATMVTVTRAGITRDELGRPEETAEKIGSFPGCITEKYLGSEEEPSHFESETRLVVVSPNAAAYQTGDVFEFGGAAYRVMVVHELEGWKNEYEVKRVEDD